MANTGQENPKKINNLIKDIDRNGPLHGIGEPELLKENLRGHYSRKINEKDRLVYRIDDSRIYIAQCYVHTITATPANVSDVAEAHNLIREEDEVCYGDSGYTGIEKREEIVGNDHLSDIEYI